MIPHIEFRGHNFKYDVYYNDVYVGRFTHFECDSNRNPVGEAKQFINTLENLKSIVADDVVDTFKYIENLTDNVVEKD